MKLAWILHGAVALLLSALLANCLATPPMERDKVLSELDKLVEEDGSIETALMNYLFAKQVANRFKSQMDMTDLQRKRSYWKQCAFNAVSCFGQKREGGGGSLGRGGGLIMSDKSPGRWNFFKNLFRFYD